MKTAGGTNTAKYVGNRLPPIYVNRPLIPVNVTASGLTKILALTPQFLPGVNDTTVWRAAFAPNHMPGTGGYSTIELNAHFVWYGSHTPVHKASKPSCTPSDVAA